MTTATAPSTPRYQHRGSIRMYLTARRALVLADATPDTAFRGATEIAARVERAYTNRDLGPHTRRGDDLARINRAAITHLLQRLIPEPHQAEAALRYIEAELGVRFPESVA